MYAYLAVQITTYILYVALRKSRIGPTNAINVFLSNDSHKFTTCMTILAINLPRTSPHRKDVGPCIRLLHLFTRENQLLSKVS